MGCGGVSMDALKFIEERNRMCNYYGGGNALSECAECPASQRTCLSVRSVTAEYITAVEQWSREHPRKTRQDVFLKQYPVRPAHLSPAAGVDGVPAGLP